MIWVWTVCKGYQQKAKVATSKELAKITFLFAVYQQTPILPLSTHKNYAPYFEMIEGAFCLGQVQK